MGKPDHIPAPAVARLSLYLRQLEAFHAGARVTVSSRELGSALRLSDAQVRKDLAYFGQFGQPGVGYRVADLIQRVRRILGTDKRTNVLLVGVGNLGRALLSFRGFSRQGFEVVAAFDKDPAKVGLHIGAPKPIEVRPVDQMPGIVERLAVRHGILTVPAPAAQGVAELMVASGIRGILNFAPVTLLVPTEVAVSSVDLGVQLEQLSFRVNGASA